MDTTMKTRDVPIAITASGHVQPHHPYDVRLRGPDGKGAPGVIVVESVPANLAVEMVTRQVQKVCLAGLDAALWRVPWDSISDANQGQIVRLTPQY